MTDFQQLPYQLLIVFTNFRRTGNQNDIQLPAKINDNPMENSIENSSVTVTDDAGSNSTGSLPVVSKQKLIQQQLFLLLHAEHCSKSETSGEDTECPADHCRLMKGVLKHLSVCTNETQCKVLHCCSSRAILAHWKECKNRDCRVCPHV